MRQGPKIAVITISVLAALILALILYFALRPKTKAQITKQALKNASSEVRDFIRDGFNTLLKLLSTLNTPVPDLYQNCPGSTINRLKFCGNLKYGGEIEVGGSAICSIPYNACRIPCSILCVACKLPFVSCGPCKSCENACKRVYDACSSKTKAEWSVNVLEVGDIGSTFSVVDFDTFALEKNATGGYDIPTKLKVSTSPKASVDIRTTAGLGNYQGAVGLGNLKLTIPLEFTYNCTTKQTTLKKFDTIQIQGLDLQFQFGGLSDLIKKEIYKLAKSKIQDTLKNKLEEKLTGLFRDFIQSELLPKLQLNITC